MISDKNSGIQSSIYTYISMSLYQQHYKKHAYLGFHIVEFITK